MAFVNADVKLHYFGTGVIVWSSSSLPGLGLKSQTKALKSAASSAKSSGSKTASTMSWEIKISTSFAIRPFSVRVLTRLPSSFTVWLMKPKWDKTKSIP